MRNEFAKHPRNVLDRLIDPQVPGCIGCKDPPPKRYQSKKEAILPSISKGTPITSIGVLLDKWPVTGITPLRLGSRPPCHPLVPEVLDRLDTWDVLPAEPTAALKPSCKFFGAWVGREFRQTLEYRQREEWAIQYVNYSPIDQLKDSRR